MASRVPPLSMPPGSRRAPSEDPSLEDGPVVAGRFVLGPSLGRGGGGEVFRGRELATGEEVALKRLHQGADPRVQREIQALARLRVPGVVRLREVLNEDERVWLVMDLVRGDPFPGRLPDDPNERWAVLLPRLRALLRTLEAMHQAGIVHRDIKPENILVPLEGDPVLLDFGLARGQALARTVTRQGAVVGTPRYLAPEVYLGGRADARSDLYSLGLLLFEALAGELPWPAERMEAMLAARSHRDPPPLCTRISGLPRRACELVDALLRRDPARRPASAAACLDALGERVGEGLPWLGSRRPVEALCRAVREGRKGAVHGPRGSGRTRCLREAMATLEAEGWHCVELPPGSAPFESLRPILDEATRARGPDAVTEALAAWVSARRGVLCVDGARWMDRWSRRALEGLPGPSLWTHDLDEGIGEALQALDEADLASLFHGPRLLLHLPEDAARLLHRRTGGWPVRVEAELRSWQQAGVARWEGGALRVSREELDRLRLHGSSLLPEGPPLEAALDEVLAAVLLASPEVRTKELCVGLGRPAWRVALEVEALEEAGALRREDDLLIPTRACRTITHWTAEHRRLLAGRFAEALAAAPLRRLSVMLREGVEEGLPEVASEAATLLWRQGESGRAMTELLASADLVPVRTGDPRVEWLLRLSIELRTGQALRRAEAALPAGPAQTLVRIAESLRLGQAEADEELVALGPLPAADVEAIRADLLVRAARLRSDEAEARVVEEQAARIGGAWAKRWRGRLADRQKRFAHSAALHEAAAADWEAVGPTLEDLLYAISAHMEAGELDAAERVAAEKALPLAEARRLSTMEARARLYLRLCRLRRDPPAEAWPEWVEAVAALGDPWLLGIVAVNEAGLALRAGRGSEGLHLARRAWSAARQARDMATATYAEAIALRLGERLDRDLPEVLRAALECGVDAVALDVTALLADRAPIGELGPRVRRVQSSLSGRPRELRQGIFRVDELESRLALISADGTSAP